MRVPHYVKTGMWFGGTFRHPGEMIPMTEQEAKYLILAGSITTDAPAEEQPAEVVAEPEVEPAPESKGKGGK
jgi:hypothetical protein